MKHIIKVNNIQDAKNNPIRPIIAMDINGVLFAEGQSAVPQIEFVDLGLSVKWSNSLLGATNGNTAESWYGNYYAWGEVETKSDYSWTNYKYAYGNYNKLTKYCNNPEFGNDRFMDELPQLVPGDDVATVTNSAWRMPTKEDFEELIAKTANSWVTDHNDIIGLNGLVFTSKVNGNTLFIPAAGQCEDSIIKEAGFRCNLWSSSLNLDGPSSAHYLKFYSDAIGMASESRFYGFSVCPVC